MGHIQEGYGKVGPTQRASSLLRYLENFKFVIATLPSLVLGPNMSSVFKELGLKLLDFSVSLLP